MWFNKDYHMTSTVSQTDREMIIWNFMEELVENHQNAIENDLPLQFNFMDFFNFGVLADGFSETEKIAVIKQYAKEQKYIKIKGETVALTKKGIVESQKQRHSWDG